ncbi:MAG TPA: aspartate aminotransferase family protein [Candidatus Nitrosotenuis sp.]|nr:aspartate aminotransferase family protein [Candidatus Nitrosotenuis sp.]
MTESTRPSSLFPRDFRSDVPVAVRGDGCYLFDAQGRKYLDACGGAAVVTIGHNVRDVLTAMEAQARELAYAHSSQFITPVAEELAALLAGKFPGPRQHVRVHFTSGGSEATETALKIARMHWLARGQPQRWKIISRWVSYHGATLGALGVSGNRVRREAYAPMLADTPHIAPCYCYRCPFEKTFPACELACARELERAIEQAGPETVAGFVCEPVVGASSGAVPPEGYLRAIREICDRYGILFIADEVMSGAGRTGKYFAVEHWDVVPDMILAGKGLASGYSPLGAVLVAENVWKPLAESSGRLDHGFTYQCHPPSLAAGLAVQKYLQQHNLVERARTMGAQLGERLQRLHAEPGVGDVRGLGLLWTVEFVEDKATRKPFAPEKKISQKIFERMRDLGVMVYPMRGAAGEGRGDHILIAPPYTISEKEIERIAGALQRTLVELASQTR